MIAVQFGYGEILLGNATGLDYKGNESACITLRAAKRPQEVADSVLNTEDLGGPDMVISFTSLKSLEVFEEQLADVRIFLEEMEKAKI